MSKTVGFYGGKFFPFHNGHLYCTIKASSMVDELHVIVCYDEEWEQQECERTGMKYFDHNKRARWIKEITKDMPNVKVHVAYNKQTMEFQDWVDGADNVLEAIGKPITHVFSSEHGYDDFFRALYEDAEHVVIDSNREQYPISATMFRKNGVFKHWDMLPQVVRKDFVKKVVVVGTESCGKSYLTRQLAKLYNTKYVEEYGRTFYEDINDFDNFYIEDFVKFTHQQKHAENEAVKVANKVLFCDTETITTLRFAVEYLNEYPMLLHRIAREQDYDLWIFLEPDVPFVEDGTREYQKNRDNSNFLLKELLKDFKVEYHVVSGDYVERLDKSIKLVDELLEG